MTRITLSSALQQRIFEHLQSTYPNEGGGFLFGTHTPDGITVADINPVTNVFAAEEQPNFDGVTYAEENWPGIPLRADEAPVIDRITVSPFRAGPALDVAASAAGSCKGAAARLTVTMKNGEGAPVGVSIETAYGTKSIDAIKPGATKSQLFAATAAELPVGEVTVTATAVIDGEEVTSTQRVPYDAVTCE